MALKRLPSKKGSTLFYIILLAGALALMLFARQCSARRIGPAPDNFAGGDTINIAIELSPSGLSLEGDSLSGEFYLRLRDLFGAHSVPVKFHPYTRTEDALEWLEKGRVRIIAGDLPVTSEARRDLIFVKPLAIDRQVLVQLPDTIDGELRLPVANQFDLAGKEVYVTANSPYVQRLVNLSKEIGDTIIVRSDSIYSSEQLVILTATRRIPRAVVSRATAVKLAPHYPALDHSVAISLNQFRSWALAPRDSILRDTIDSWLSSEPVDIPQ